MASLTPNILPKDPHTQIFIVGATVVLLVGIIFASTLKPKKSDKDEPSTWESLVRFVYACFLKPHDGDASSGQQAALESFYKAQADVYDATRKTLLRGREDMLALVAAQLVHKAAKERGHDPKRIWVDVSFLEIPRLPWSSLLTAYSAARSVVELATTSKPCPHMSQFPTSSPASTSSTFRPLSAKWLGSDSLGSAGIT
jgi:hypothetical protein